MSGSYDLNAHFNKSVGSCELILSASNRDDQKDDVVFKARLAEDVQENGLAKGVKPGEKGDPFRAFRFAKQACLIGVWICIVSLVIDFVHIMFVSILIFYPNLKNNETWLLDCGAFVHNIMRIPIRATIYLPFNCLFPNISMYTSTSYFNC